ncbi:MYCBP-associated protein isoform X1 [Hippoglossus stenolepis]|uniref:MYCBP-associated protein isoform X1 n=2 Tax=Hippoglossus stenolepis TaxID=195615 RepID=UPI001FB03CDF|nr:MYCBP-associated protein isoform X1 [Hippoglossus stenolepis]
MNRGEKTEFRPSSHSENKTFSSVGGDRSKKSSSSLMDIQAEASHPQLLVLKPPKGHQKTVLTSCVGKIHPVKLDTDSQSLCYSGLEGLQFDDQGMVLPHSILGTLEDFRSYLETKGETELVEQVPNSKSDASYEIPGRHHCEAVEKGRELSSGHRDIQGNALQNWQTHMTQRRRQQHHLSDLLHRPVKTLLMNQDNHFRETQEQKEFLTQVMPLIHSGYGYRVGSEFWTLPQRYGDEMSGITATLTQTEQGRREPVTHIGQPSGIQQETGIRCAKNLRPASQPWEQSAYLQDQYQELGELLQDMDLKKPDLSGLEVIGFGEPFRSVTVCQSPSLEREGEKDKEHKEEKKENLEPLAQSDEARSEVLLGPALRFCGQLAIWTGNSANNQGEVGISTTIMFEALTGERPSSHLKMHNEGTTAIFYSWQQLPRQNSFPNLRTQTKSRHFYFNSSSGVILPGDTQRVEFIFKSEKPGIDTEVWQLNTHPVLLQGASMQVTLRGVALYQDKTTDQRNFIETKLENTVMVKMCRSMACKMVSEVRTPERPSSPAELYITEEQRFLHRNPKLQYHHQPVEDLKRLWEEVNPGHSWDLSVDALRQAVLSLPEQESSQDTREKNLAQLNSLLLQLSEPTELNHRLLTAAAIGQQLWRRLLDSMADEAMWLKNQLGLIKTQTLEDKQEELLLSDADADDMSKDGKSEKKGGAAAKEKRRDPRSRVNEGTKSPTSEKSVEESKKKGKRRDEGGKRSKEKQGKESVPLPETSPESNIQELPDEVDPKMMKIYTRLLHKKVYALMEDLVDTMCDLMDEGNES